MNAWDDDKFWKEELLESTIDDSFKYNLLKYGARSHMQSFYLHSLYCKWRRSKGYVEPPVPDCSSSLKESMIKWRKKDG